MEFPSHHLKLFCLTRDKFCFSISQLTNINRQGRNTTWLLVILTDKDIKIILKIPASPPKKKNLGAKICPSSLFNMFSLHKTRNLQFSLEVSDMTFYDLLLHGVSRNKLIKLWPNLIASALIQYLSLQHEDVQACGESVQDRGFMNVPSSQICVLCLQYQHFSCMMHCTFDHRIHQPYCMLNIDTEK